MRCHKEKFTKNSQGKRNRIDFVDRLVVGGNRNRRDKVVGKNWRKRVRGRELKLGNILDMVSKPSAVGNSCNL